MAVFRILIGFVAAVATAAIVGSAFGTQIGILALAKAGGAVPLSLRLSMTWSDIQNFGPAYAAVIAIGFAAAFSVAAYLKRILVPLAPLAYPLAGAAAIAAALVLMTLWFKGETVVAATRDALGFTLQCLAGALGGAVFGWIAKKRN